MAHTYDSLQIGDSHTWSGHVTQENVQTFADLTGDDNPLHVDPDYAGTTPFGATVVHGAYVLGLASKVLGRDFPGHGSIAVSLSAKFLRPVYVGDEVTIEVRVAGKNERFRHVKIKMYAYTEGRMAAACEAVMIPPTE